MRAPSCRLLWPVWFAMVVVVLGSGCADSAEVAPEDPPSGWASRPLNLTCAAPGDLPAALLSQTGCVEPTAPKRAVQGAIPYQVNAALWSDGADKERYFAVPEGSTVGLAEDGDFIFPVGTVLLKAFKIHDVWVETRLFARQPDGSWAGFSYAWNEAQTDAELLPGAATRTVAGHRWNYPGRDDCLRCHTEAAGWALGPELGQLNRDQAYPSGRTYNQLATLSFIGILDGLAADPAQWPRYPQPQEESPVEARARAYLHANCSGCHRPGGPTPASIDFRFGIPLSQMKICDVDASRGTAGLENGRILAPGAPERSILSARLHATDGWKMPPVGRNLADPQGDALIDAWITSLSGCP